MLINVEVGVIDNDCDIKSHDSRKRNFDDEEERPISHPIIPTTILAGAKKTKREKKSQQKKVDDSADIIIVGPTARMMTRAQSRRASAVDLEISTTKQPIVLPMTRRSRRIFKY